MDDFIQTGPAMDEAMDKSAAARRGIRAYNRLGWAFVIFLSSLLVLGNLVVIILSSVNPDLLSSPFFGMPMNYIFMYFIGFPLMLLLLRKLPDAPARPAEGDGGKMRPLMMLALYPVLYAIVGIVNMAATGIESLLGTSSTVNVSDIMANSLPQWVTFVLGVIVAPIMEEIVFRRLVHKKASGYGKAAYVLWSAVIFGLFHMNFGQSIYAAGLGAIFALIMIRTGSVLYPAILHVAINLTGGIGLGSIILGSGNETATTIYTVYLFALMALGVVIGIVLLVRMRRTAKADPEPDPAVIKKRAAFLNPGSLVYCLVCLGVIVLGFFM